MPDPPAVVVKMQPIAAVAVNVVSGEQVVAREDIGALPFVFAGRPAVVVNRAVQHLVERAIPVVV